MKAGRESCTAAPSLLASKHHVLHSDTQEGALESLPIPHHSAAPRNDFTWPEMLWLRLQPASCLGKGVRHYEASGNSLHWVSWLVFYPEIELLQLTSHTTQLTKPQKPLQEQSEPKAGAARTFKMDSVRYPMASFSRLQCITLLSTEHFLLLTFACRGNRAGQLIPGTKTPGMKAVKQVTQFTQQNLSCRDWVFILLPFASLCPVHSLPSNFCKCNGDVIVQEPFTILYFSKNRKTVRWKGLNKNFILNSLCF